MWPAACFTVRGCYNVASTWSFNAGIPYTKKLEEQIMADLAQPYIGGLTLLGEAIPEYWHSCLSLKTHSDCPTKIFGVDNYAEEMMLETPDKLELSLAGFDILVDGLYDKSKHNLMLQFEIF